jgi:hypothetical protein
VSETTLKRIKKRQEKVGNFVYDEWDDLTDESIRSNMGDIRNFTSPTSIALKFSG